MENRIVNKIKVSVGAFAKLESAESDLRDLIQSGGGTPKILRALLSIQTLLLTVEPVKSFPSPTWTFPEPPECA